MSEHSDDCIKHRDIYFASLYDQDEPPSQLATLLLADAPGIINLYPQSGTRLHVSYDLKIVTLNIIESALREVGFHLANTLMFILLRALYHYTE